MGKGSPVPKPVLPPFVKGQKDFLADRGFEPIKPLFAGRAQQVAPWQILDQSVRSIDRAQSARDTGLAQPIADELRDDVAPAEGTSAPAEIAGAARWPKVR